MKKAIIITLSAALLGGCASAVSPVGGFITISKWDGGVSNPGIAEAKTGKSCVRSIMGIGGGNASINKAMQDGNITKTANVDHSSVNMLGFFASYCTIVTGE